MNKIGWIVFSAIVALLIGGLVVWTRIANPPIDVSGVNLNSVLSGTSQSGNIGDHYLGSKDGKVLFVEYGDFECPSCKAAYANINALSTLYGDKLTVVFRNFPLTTIHPNARAAAAAAEAAGLQGKFWKMHDLLYANQDDWASLDSTKRTDVFKTYASTLGLNLDTFTKDSASKEVSQKISFDQALGKRLNLSATPSFFLNGTSLDTTTADGIVQGDLTSIKTQLDALTK